MCPDDPCLPDDILSDSLTHRGTEQLDEVRGEQWCWVHEFNGHDTSVCGKFRSMSASERLELAKKRGSCFICLRVGHISKNCNQIRKCTVKINDALCNRRHHSLLHEAFTKGIGAVISSGCSVRPTVLLDVTTVYSPSNVPIKVLWDSGSNITLITHRMARKLGSQGIPVSGTMTKVGNVAEEFSSKEYRVELVDKWGKKHNIVATGIDEIASPVSKIDISELSHMFSSVDWKNFKRPFGDLDMLIGTDYSILLPQPIARADRLELTENVFGFSIRGCLPAENGSKYLGTKAEINNVKFILNLGVTDMKRDDLKGKLDEFFSVENAGMTCAPQCARCLCRKCPVSEELTLKEERELALIEKGLLYDEDNKQWIASYPWIKRPYMLPNNYAATLGRLKSTEKRLLLDLKQAEAYQKELVDMIIRGVARKLDKTEIDAYEGPVHYIAHHAVLKPDSVSTPVRIVFDSSTQYMGHRLNDYWAKGPNILNSLIGILLRFRENYIGIAGDISKMYHSVKLQAEEEHVHRFLWRDMDLTRQPDQYVLTRVTFGDRPSGAIATLALRYTAEMQKEFYPSVAQVISNDTYMDDILTSVRDLESAKILTQDIEKVLLEGGFRIKHWIMSGDHGRAMNINLSEGTIHKILGMQWCTMKDEFSFKVKINFSKRVKRIHTGPDLNVNEFDEFFPTVLTRRMVLSQIASIYDPLGLITPYVLKAKILMRDLITTNEDAEGNKTIKWDEPMSEAMQKEWKAFFIGLYGIQNLTFPRCIKPLNVDGCPILILFSDASKFAYGCCAYIRWVLNSGEVVVRLVAAKNRIAPNRQITIPRLELCGAVLASRLRHTLIKELKLGFQEIIHIVDSTIVRAQIQKESYYFKTFVATRVAEIQSKTEPREWWWVDSTHNVADLVTKPHEPCELHSKSFWQNGPEFFSQPRELWPIYQNVDNELMNQDNVMVCESSLQPEGQSCIQMEDFDLGRFNSYNKLIKVTARVLSVYKRKSLKALFEMPSNKFVESAERLWIMEAQKGITDWRLRLKNLGPSMENGILVVGCRIQTWLKNNWNRDNFIFLPKDHLLSRLIVTELHNVNHEGIETTLAKLLSKFWVPGARRLIKSVKGKCVKCRRFDKNLQEQCMGQVIEGRLKPSPPFYHTATDLFGPFAIRDSVKRRTHGKCFGVIFTCLSSRAVHLDIVENYSTEAFIGAIQRFVSIRGYPYSIHSDNGTQMVAANKELIKISRELDKRHIVRSMSNKGVEWSFNRSSDAPWLNGSCESLIKSVKMSIQKAIGESILTYAEFHTVLFEIANLINPLRTGS
ncbi:uncharacterized protein LOC122260556 [Penaeus japonicus]|uniref:uncharacterized protein LOC122260556 n=1 Tax=Penaeus japonicus TaxID=27405 RepID=UPI001C70E790|nr:uncharacterized protein LOC122260556 [Penaeus japonicus]